MKKVVVLDSEPIVRQVVERILERAGYSVTVTEDFQQALEMISGQLPDLVITNVYLKNIAGHDAMRTLKASFPQLPVLMVSGLPDEKTITEWITEPGFDVFPKPFLPKDLVQKVAEILGDFHSQT